MLVLHYLGARERPRVGELSGVERLHAQAELGALFGLGLGLLLIVRVRVRVRVRVSTAVL